MSSTSLFAPQFVHGVYIPSALLIVGLAIIKKEWAPYGVIVAAILGGWKIFANQPRKVLIPDKFQEFELKEKTILSHNTAMYVKSAEG